MEDFLPQTEVVVRRVRQHLASMGLLDNHIELTHRYGLIHYSFTFQLKIVYNILCPN